MTMYYTHADIRGMILDEWEQFENTQYPQDILAEMAEGVCPIYYGDILESWQQMPREFDDYWQEVYGLRELPDRVGIMQLMSIDLFNYYLHAFTKAYNEICEEKGVAND